MSKARPEPELDVAAVRGLVQFTQAQFAEALGISVRTLQNWEQNRTAPDGPGLALVRLSARYPHIIREFGLARKRDRESGNGTGP